MSSSRLVCQHDISLPLLAAAFKSASGRMITGALPPSSTRQTDAIRHTLAQTSRSLIDSLRGYKALGSGPTCDRYGDQQKSSRSRPRPASRSKHQNGSINRTRLSARETSAVLTKLICLIRSSSIICLVMSGARSLPACMIFRHPAGRPASAKS